MTKTHRKKINKRPERLYGRNTQVVVVEQGHGMKVKGVRKDVTKMQNEKDAKPIHVDRVYTGINLGKVYPYASTKRGGGGTAPAKAEA